MSSTPNSPISRTDRRAAILALAGVRQTKPTTIPGPDGPVAVVIRELLASEARDFELAAAKGSPNALGLLLQMSIADIEEPHELLFEPTDRGTLQSLGVFGLKEALELMQELSGVTDDDLAKARQSLAAGLSNGSS